MLIRGRVDAANCQKSEAACLGSRSFKLRSWNPSHFHMSYSLNSLKRGVYRGLLIWDYYRITIGVIQGDTRSLDNGSYIKAIEPES